MVQVFVIALFLTFSARASEGKNPVDCLVHLEAAAKSIQTFIDSPGASTLAREQARAVLDLIRVTSGLATLPPSLELGRRSLPERAGLPQLLARFTQLISSHRSIRFTTDMGETERVTLALPLEVHQDASSTGYSKSLILTDAIQLLGLLENSGSEWEAVLKSAFRSGPVSTNAGRRFEFQIPRVVMAQVERLAPGFGGRTRLLQGALAFGILLARADRSQNSETDLADIESQLRAQQSPLAILSNGNGSVTP